MRIGKWLQRIASVLAGWSALSGLQLAPLPAAVAAWAGAVLAGVLHTPLEVGLALYASITTGLLGFVAARRLKPRRVKPAPPAKPKPPSRWLPDPKDFTTLALNDAQLDIAWARCQEVARAELRGAADMTVWLLFIAIERDPHVVFEADSPTVGRTVTITIYPDSHTATHENHVWGGGDRRGPVWRDDPSWRDLARMVWQREGPGVEVVLYDRPDIVAGESLWWARANHSDALDRPNNHYTLREGRLVPYR